MLDKDYWDNRYQTEETGWDIGSPSTPLKNYIDTLEDKSLKILIPGCGRAYEAEYLHQQGFNHVVVLDFSLTALQEFAIRVPTFPKEHLIATNFFNHQGQYDVLLEQTFFCAIDVNLREDYVVHASSLLNNKGKITGLLFAQEFGNDYPPFGGTKKQYQSLFNPSFEIEKMELAKDSIEARKGRELFITFKKKKS